jgi:hypothetical protein
MKDLVGKDLKIFLEVLSETSEVFMGSKEFEDTFFLIELAKQINPSYSWAKILSNHLIRIQSTYPEPLGLFEDKNHFYIEDLKALNDLIFETELSEMSLYINSDNLYKRTIAIWRLKIGK